MQQSQQTDYYCGPATASEILGEKGHSYSQSFLAGSSYLDTTLAGTSWGPPSYMQDTLNNLLNTNNYVAVNGSGVGGGFSASDYEADLTVDIYTGWPIAGNVVVPKYGLHLVGHPVDQTIYHWIAIKGYNSSGGNTTYADSVYGAQTVPDWALFAYNRTTGQVTELAQAVRVGGQVVGGPYPSPIVSHDSVVWGQATGPSSPDDYNHYVVQLDDLKSGHITTLATQAVAPAYSWPWVEWDQYTSGSNGLITLKNLVTGQTLAMSDGPASVTIAGMSMAYDDGHSAGLIDDFTRDLKRPRVLITVYDPDHVQFVSVSGRLVAWQEDSKTQVYDRVEQRVVQLPIHNGNLLSWTGGHILLWVDQEAQVQQAKEPPGWSPVPTLMVLDTTALPTTSPSP